MGAQETHEQPSVQARLQLASNIARALNSANNAIQLYPADSPMPREAAAGFIATLDRFLMFEPYLQLTVSGDRLSLDQQDVCGTSSSVGRFAFQLHSRQIGQIRFLPGLGAEECVQFLRILGMDPDALRAKGGMVKALVAGGVDHVKVVDLAQEAAAESAGQARPDAVQVQGVSGLREEALVSSDAGEAREWLHQAADAMSAHRLGAAELARVLAVEAGKALSFGGGDTELGLDNLSQAITSLDESSRGGLIAAMMSSTEAAAAALGSLLGRINEEELVSALAGLASERGCDPTDLLGASPLGRERRDRMAGKANALMRMRASEQQAQTARPEPPPLPHLAPVDETLPRYARKGDDVPFSATRLATDARQFTREERDGLLQAPQEAGVSEVDKPMITLLYLLNHAKDEESATATIGSIIDTATYALDMGAVETVTRGICGLRLASDGLGAASPHAQRLEDAIGRLSGAEVAGKVIESLDGEAGAARVVSVTTYFASAQPSAQEAVMDAVGSDISPELRSRATAVLKGLGPRAIGVLERHVVDRRWIVAHSAVVALSGMKEARVAPALRRALGHTEPRVVEAALRGLAAVGGRDAEEAVAWSIERGLDSTRKLAVELAGRMRAGAAVAVLGRIVTAGDLFGRTLPEKLAAIDALAAIGTPEAINALDGAARTRFLFSPGKTRRLREHVAAAKGGGGP